MIRTATILVLVLLSSAVHAERSALANYQIHCMGCHLDDGRGHAPEVPDVRGEMGQMLRVPGGRSYLVQVPGASQAPISDAELAAVVNYMLRTFSADTLPGDFRPLSSDEVRDWRADWLHEVLPVRERLLARIAALPD